MLTMYLTKGDGFNGYDNSVLLIRNTYSLLNSTDNAYIKDIEIFIII